MGSLPEEILKILEENGVDFEVREFSSETHSASDAAKALNCPLQRIVKSIVVEKQNKDFCLFLIRGDHHLNIESFKRKGINIKRLANPVKVQNITGFPVGGTPPFGHKNKIETFIDESLLKFPELWFGGGKKNVLFKIKSRDLLKCCPDGVVIDLE